LGGAGVGRFPEDKLAGLEFWFWALVVGRKVVDLNPEEKQ